MVQHLEVVDPQVAPPVWAALRSEALQVAKTEPSLASLVNAVIIRHKSFAHALSYQLARKLGDQELRAMSLRETAEEAYAADPTIVDKAEAIEGVKVFQAGTAMNAGALVANGGRVLNVTATGASVSDAQAKAYEAVDVIDWPQGFCRRDIGWRAVARERAAG